MLVLVYRRSVKESKRCLSPITTNSILDRYFEGGRTLAACAQANRLSVFFSSHVGEGGVYCAVTYTSREPPPPEKGEETNKSVVGINAIHSNKKRSFGRVGTSFGHNILVLV